MNKNIIIGALIIVIVAIIGVFVFSNGKINTEINFLSETNLKNGNDIAIQLKDTQGNTLSEQNITIIYESNGNNEEYYVITDEEGKAYLTLTDEPIGEHKVTVKYEGNDKYNGCTGEQTITIDGVTEDNTQTQSKSTASTVKYHTNESSATTGSNSKTNSTSNSNSQYNHKPNSNSKSNTTYKSNSTYNSNSKTSSNSNSKSNYNSKNYDPKKEYVSQLYYDSELKVYYDDFGTVHGGKYDGKEIVDVRANRK